MRRGIRFAIDYGDVRIGLARSDEEAIIALPVETVPNGESLFTDIAALIPVDCLEIYVGLPINLLGKSTPATLKAVAFANALAEHVSSPVRVLDERLTTAIASSQLREVGLNSKQSKSFIDQQAAVEILEYALNVERNTGQIPGLTLEEWSVAND
ncbi:MAG: Holliday junction resolvase RuvX [Rhodoluna sp.]